MLVRSSGLLNPFANKIRTNPFSNFSTENTFLTCDENDLECIPQYKHKIKIDAFDKIQPLRYKRLHLISRKTKIVPGITFQKLAFHFIKQVQKCRPQKIMFY